MEKGRAQGWFLNEDRRFELDVHENRIHSAGNTFAGSHDDVFVGEDDIYVNMKVFAQCFPLDLKYDASLQNLEVSPHEKLPFQARLEREGKWQEYRPQSPMEAQLPLAESRYRFMEPLFMDMGGTFRYGNSDSDSMGGRYYALARGDLAFMNSEIYLSGDDESPLDDVRVTLQREDPRANLLGPMEATSFSLGDVRLPHFPIAGGGGTERGVAVDNIPLNQSAEFDTTFFEGNTGPGWDVELYRNGVLLDSMRVGADGQYRFEEIQLYHGENEFHMKFFGPQGQEREEVQRRYVGGGMITQGEHRYMASLSQKDSQVYDPDDEFDAEDEGSMRFIGRYQYGLSKNISLQAGLMSQESHGDPLVHLNLGAKGSMGDTFFSADAVHDMQGGSAVEGLVQKKLGDINLKFKQQFYQDFTKGGTSSASDSVESSTQLSADGIILGAKYVPDLPFSLDYNRTVRKYSSQESIGGRLAVDWNNVHVSSRLDWETESDESSNESSSLKGSSLANVRLGKWRLRGGLDYYLSPESELEKITTSAQYDFGDGISSDFSLTHNKVDGDVTTGTLGLNWNNGKFILSPKLSYDSNHNFNASLSFNTSIGTEPWSGEVKPSSIKKANHGALSARVYLDHNNNKVFDRGDTPLERVKVESKQGGGTAETDENGVAFFTGLQAYHRTDIVLQKESLEDPCLEPVSEGNSILPRPGHVNLLDIPVIPTGEVDGTLYIADGNGGKKALTHAPLQLIDKAGTVVGTTKSEYDGFYLFMKVPPGEYFVRLDPAFEKTLGQGALPGKGVTINSQGNVVSNMDLVFGPTKIPPTSIAGARPDSKVSPGISPAGGMLPGPASTPPSVLAKSEIPESNESEPLSPSPMETVSRETVPMEQPKGEPNFGLHLSSYRSMEKALAGIRFEQKKYGDFLEDADFSIVKMDLGSKGTWYRVCAGTGSREDMARLKSGLKLNAPYARVMSLKSGEKGVHLASYRTKENALKGVKRFKRLYLRDLGSVPFQIQSVDLGKEKGIWHRVIAGKFTKGIQAAQLQKKIKEPYCKPMMIGRTDQFSIQAAVFKTYEEAVNGAKKIIEANPQGTLSIRKADPHDPNSRYQILMGRFDHKEDAQKIITSMKVQGRQPSMVHI
ncbi:MAG: hypothetical protein MI747_13290 [Desulfobacterales bacterium]|nr:hypothetical protein [Desulfobacterales bacterium]